MPNWSPAGLLRCRSCRAEALGDADLIRTKVNLIPETVTEVRIVDIVGLDKQADGGTHVASTDEVGRIRVVKTESKGKGNKRIRIQCSRHRRGRYKEPFGSRDSSPSSNSSPPARL